MKSIKILLKQTATFILITTIVCGVIYPLAVTGISQLFFKDKANGSIIEVDGKQYGSKLLGQKFTGDRYLWGRVMYDNTGTYHDEEGNALYYAGPSNLTPASEDYRSLITERAEAIKASNPAMINQKVPVDLVTGSGSGLDPHISVAAAMYQVDRIAKVRNISTEQVEDIINQYTTGKLLGVLGEKVVNVLEVNLALDGILN
ncbi:K+-transporting ATPase ATPase C chain [Anaerosporobacter mobilis DSM 15930]|jgi:K+-transporting ATPase ATPase C chain|uniref:Potassium-transporting ATPase KdpC subunit n=1 Tax=Anaerosporobacter mobilis DSM 15930 TaxID=1120996 RepID=A0A1M7LMT7_9FIRM|nr:K(+)-transporting ATPase subunit C [Anaerosporobacter mobilis]SHM79467.1 K+-transporting ATPase ATPase C chain [Anaerosporobacter mobilis DSM 15930]